jgi:hypothetical protein
VCVGVAPTTTPAPSAPQSSFEAAPAPCAGFDPSYSWSPVEADGSFGVTNLNVGDYQVYVDAPHKLIASNGGFERRYSYSAAQWLQGTILKPTGSVITVAPGATEQISATTFPNRTFADVPTGAQFFREISWLGSTGVTTGYSNGTYAPLGTVNRDAMAAFMYRLAGSPEFTPPSVSPFSDVKPSTQFYREITWLASQGISTGWAEPNGSRTYRPLQPVARDAMAAFTYRFASKFAGSTSYAPPATSPFTDVTPRTQFYKEITWLASRGISTGWKEATGPTYRPLNSVARDAMAAFMSRTTTVINSQP